MNLYIYKIPPQLFDSIRQKKGGRVIVRDPQIKDFHTSLLLVLSFISVVFILAIQSQTSASYMSLIQIDNNSDRNFWQQKQQLL